MELDGGRLKLRVLLDRSMLGAYVNGTNSLTSRVYPTRKDATGLRLTSEGGSARVVSLDVWRMNGAYDTSVAPATYDPPPRRTSTPSPTTTSPPGTSPGGPWSRAPPSATAT